jgi:hypothetical protein
MGLHSYVTPTPLMIITWSCHLQKPLTSFQSQSTPPTASHLQLSNIFFFLMVLGFELRVLSLLGRHVSHSASIFLSILSFGGEGSGIWTRGQHLEHLHQPFFMIFFFFFEIWSLKLLVQAGIQTTILLISACWVAKITDMSHWYLTFWAFYIWNHTVHSLYVWLLLFTTGSDESYFCSIFSPDPYISISF